MASYTEVWAIVEGCAEDVGEFTDEAEMQKAIYALAADANREGVTVEVYCLWHGHAPEHDECACAQYVTDHHPDYVFGPVQ